MCTFLQKQARPGEQQGGNGREEKRREMCRGNWSLKIQTGLRPRFRGYFTLVQCCHEQTE